MTKRCVRIAYGSETVEKKKKKGQSRASAKRLMYADQSPHMQTRP